MRVQTQRVELVGLIVLALSMGLVPVVEAQATPATTRPATAGPSSRHDLIATKLAFNRRTLAGDYARVGSRNPKWDSAVEAFLEGVALYFTRSGESIWYSVDAPGSAELLVQAQKLSELGCNDPLVRYCHAVVQMDQGGDEPTLKAIHAQAVDAYQKLRESNYNAFRKASAAKRVVRIAYLPSSPWINDPVLPQAEKDAFDLDVACFLTDAFPPEEARVLLEQVWNPRLAGDPKAADLKQFADAVAATKVHEWAALIVQADAARRVGWEARGSGYANTVTEEGWAVFRPALTEAGQFYLRAHELRPDWPEGAAGLIHVAMVGHAPPGTDAEHWFEKATAAQIDFDTAWVNYRQSLLPRWGGSHGQMLDLGRKALATERWDTDLPSRFLYQVRSIAWDNNGDWQAVREIDPAVWPDLQRMFAGIIAYFVERGRWNANHFAAERLAVAWALHEWENAAALLAPGGEEAGVDSKPFRSQTFATVGMTEQAAVAEIVARTGPQSQAIERAERLDASRNQEAAKEAWKSVLADMAAEDAGRAFVEARLREIEFQGLLAAAPAGEWVDVPVDLKYWEAVQGDWKVDDGKFIATVTQDRRSQDPRWGKRAAAPTLVFLPRMPDTYEVRATLLMPRDTQNVPCLYGSVGLVPGWSAHEGGSVYFAQYTDILRVRFPTRNQEIPMRNSQVEPVMEIRVAEDGSIALYVNGRVRMERGSRIAPPAGGTPRRIAITSADVHMGDTFVVHSVQVRRPE